MMTRYLPQRITAFLFAGLLFVGLGAAHPSQAQEAENAVLRARDAFGERVGVEQVGLYNENQVRGFSLNDTGSYRIDGLYFLREFQLPDTLLAGVTVKVGVNAARLDYPSPSGVVDYRLKDAKPGDRQLSVNFGLRDYGTKFAESAGSYAPEHGRWGVAGGLQAIFDVRYPNGTSGGNYGIGLVPVFRPADNVRVRVVGSADRSSYDGDYSTISAIPGVLPPRTYGKNLSPPWARVVRKSYNAGVLSDITLSSQWSFAGSVFYSDTQRSPQDFTLVSLRPDFKADATLQPTLDQHTRSLTGGAIAKYQISNNIASHTFSIAARGRQTRDVRDTLPTVRIGQIDANKLVYPARPATPGPVSRIQSNVDQFIGSLSYGASFFDRFEFRSGVHRNRYIKTVTAANGTISRRPENKWLYNASTVFAATSAVTLFANTVKGVEESGIAPPLATNRGEVLAPVVATEYEVGARYEFTPKVNLTLAGFDVTKPTFGLRPDNIFASVGKVNHRGFEFSLSGEIAPGTNIVLGAMKMKPRLSGQLVDRGTIGRAPVAISSSLGLASIDYRLPWAPNWSLDGRVTWQGPRPVNVTNTLNVKGYALLAAGGRYSTDWDGHPLLLRLSVSNLFTDRPFFVQPGGLLGQSPGTTVRLTLRIGLIEN